MANRQKMLVVDDERDVVVGFQRVFERDNLDIAAAFSGEEALDAISRERPDVVLMDMRMPGLGGIDALKKVRALDPRQIVILMTAYTTSGTVIEAMKHGAYDFLMKPFSIEKLRQVVHEALAMARDMASARDVAPVRDRVDGGDAIVGKSEAMQRVYKVIGQVAPSSATVLVTGESGTGKELVARAIHRHSDRAAKPFVAINCAAIPEALLESELFGHEKGSFTSAIARRLGKFELAHEGTLFLDEIGDMPAATQTKILRVLQSGEFERIGGADTVRVNVRIIAATNRDLEQMMGEGRFRADLFYRLNVVRLGMPPLRERREDIPTLIEHFLASNGGEKAQRGLRISPSAMEKLLAHDWPGNVRELENAVRHAAITVKTDTILATDIRLKNEPAHAAGSPGPGPAVEDIEARLRPLFDDLVAAREGSGGLSTFDVVERALIVHALTGTGGNQLRAAGLLGITRSTLRKRIARYGIEVATTVRRPA